MKKTRFIIDGLLPEGISILCGAPKIGKSWLMLWTCLQVAEGKHVWGMETHKCDVLYLCLEDPFSRIQDRLYSLTESAPSNLYFAVTSGQLGNGLQKQIHTHMENYPETGLIVIDTLQKVRNAEAERDSCTSRLADLRKELKTAKGIIADVPRMKEEIKMGKDLNGKEVRLKFELSSCDLYSFIFE